MAERNDKPILNALRGTAVEPKPVWMMRQAGRYLPEYLALRSKTSDFMTLCLTPELATEVTLQPIKRFGFDAAILFADILLVPHALGQRVWFEQGEGPKLEPLTEDVRNRFEKNSSMSALAPVYETIARTKAKLPTGTTLIGFAGAPWTVATYMIAGGSSDDSTPTRLFALRNPDAFAALIETLVEATATYLIAQAQAGAEALQLFESWAGTIPAGKINAFSVEPLRRIIAKVHERAPNIPIIVFPRGAGANYGAYASIGAAAISVDTHTPLNWVRRQAGNAALQGNLDPLALIAGGSSLTAAIDQILTDTRGTPHIFNLGHGIRPETPIAHVEQMLAHIRTRRS